MNAHLPCDPTTSTFQQSVARFRTRFWLNDGVVVSDRQMITIVRLTADKSEPHNSESPLSISLDYSENKNFKVFTIPAVYTTGVAALREQLHYCIQGVTTPWLLFLDNQVSIPPGVLPALHDLVVSKHGLLPAGLYLPQTQIEPNTSTSGEVQSLLDVPPSPLSGLLVSAASLMEIVAYVNRNQGHLTTVTELFGDSWQHLAEAGICVIPLEDRLFARYPVARREAHTGHAKTPSTNTEIKNQFESHQRVTEMVTSYGLAPVSGGIAVDHFEPLRQEYIERLIAAYAPPDSRAAILDIGCGLGSLVRGLTQKGYNPTGIDLSERLIQIGKDSLKAAGIQEDRLLVADLFNWQPPHRYQCIIASGVIWYYPLERRIAFLDRMAEMLTDTGYIICVHRNDLFNLFALNQGTADFFSEHCLREVSIIAPTFSEPDLASSVPGLKDPIQKHTSSALTKYYENPLTIHTTYAAAGLTCLEVGYTYIHPAPPRCGITVTPELARACQVRFESSWQGMLSGSQFVVVSTKTEPLPK